LGGGHSPWRWWRRCLRARVRIRPGCRSPISLWVHPGPPTPSGAYVPACVCDLRLFRPPGPSPSSPPARRLEAVGGSPPVQGPPIPRYRPLHRMWYAPLSFLECPQYKLAVRRVSAPTRFGSRFSNPDNRLSDNGCSISNKKIPKTNVPTSGVINHVFEIPVGGFCSRFPRGCTGHCALREAVAARPLSFFPWRFSAPLPKALFPSPPHQVSSSSVAVACWALCIPWGLLGVHVCVLIFLNQRRLPHNESVGRRHRQTP